MRSGSIVEQGTHDELLARAGAYYELYETQFSVSAADEGRLRAPTVNRTAAANAMARRA